MPSGRKVDQIWIRSANLTSRDTEENMKLATKTFAARKFVTGHKIDTPDAYESFKIHKEPLGPFLILQKLKNCFADKRGCVWSKKLPHGTSQFNKKNENLHWETFELLKLQKNCSEDVVEGLKLAFWINGSKNLPCGTSQFDKKLKNCAAGHPNHEN